MKHCYHCTTLQPLTNFYSDKYTKDGFKSCCKKCAKERSKAWRKNNPEKAKAGIVRWRAENQDYWNDYCKYFRGDLDSFDFKGQRKGRNRDEARSFIKKWKSQHDEENREKNSVYHKKRAQQPGFRDRVNVREKVRRETDLNYKIGLAFRGRVSGVLRGKGITKVAATMSLIGCSVEQFRRWLEMNFQEGMTWANYGQGMDKWNIEHWTPCASYDLRDVGQLRACFNWSNQFPCWQLENLRKGKKQMGPLSPERQARVSEFSRQLDLAA